jgi:hypothetical protein
MFSIVAIVSFAIALLMHLFGWGSGKVNVLTFELIGFLCLSLSGVSSISWPWKKKG